MVLANAQLRAVGRFAQIDANCTSDSTRVAAAQPSHTNTQQRKSFNITCADNHEIVFRKAHSPTMGGNAARAKAEKMRKKTLEVRQVFALPRTERVIQNYLCSLHNKLVPTLGTLWITQNYLCFRGSIERKQIESIALRCVRRVARAAPHVWPGVHPLA